MHLHRLLGSSLAVCAALCAGAAQAVTIDFNQFHNTEDAVSVDAALADISGYSFLNSCPEPGACLIAYGTAYPEPGTVLDMAGASVTNSYQFTTTTLKRADGQSFNLLTMDLADGYNQGLTFVPGPGGGSYVASTLTFTFQYATGASSTRSVALDAQPGGQTVDFSQTGLKSVSWTMVDNRAYGAYQFDNVVVTTAVPEPGTWALMLGGMGLVGIASRRRAATSAFS